MLDVRAQQVFCLALARPAGWFPQKDTTAPARHAYCDVWHAESEHAREHTTQPSAPKLKLTGEMNNLQLDPAVRAKVLGHVPTGDRDARETYRRRKEKYTAGNVGASKLGNMPGHHLLPDKLVTKRF